MEIGSNLKILYVTYDGLTDPLGQSQILPYLIELSKRGFRFTILSFEKKQRLRKEGAIIRSIVDNAGIEWVPLLFTSKPPILSKAYDRYRMWQNALYLHKKKGFEIVHCRSYLAAEVGLHLKRKIGVKFLFDMRGFWADEKVDNGQWDLKKTVYRKVYNYYKRKEKEFLLSANGIISLTEAAKNYLLNKEEFQHLSIDVIPCCADLDHFDYHKIDEALVEGLKKKLNIPDNAKVITYLGSVGGWYMTKEMFSFFKWMLNKDADFHMLILTKDDPDKIKREATDIGISEKKITITYSMRKNLPLHLSLSWCSIFFIRNSFSKMASSPTKHAELMGMGIPVICNDIGDTGNIIKRTATGLIVNDFDDSAMEKAIASIDYLQSIPKWKIRAAAQEIFDLKTGVGVYLSIYQKLKKYD